MPSIEESLVSMTVGLISNLPQEIATRKKLLHASDFQA
jgi:hypothetical protein